MYTVTNKSKEVRKFRDGFTGKDVFLGPDESTFCKTPPSASEIFQVENSNKPKINKKEDKKDDSRRSR